MEESVGKMFYPPSKFLSGLVNLVIMLLKYVEHWVRHSYAVNASATDPSGLAVLRMKRLKVPNLLSMGYIHPY
jgi:hypothetical protein